MAKIEGDQQVPAELKGAYLATLGIITSDEQVKKRHPFRRPVSQTKAGRPSKKQLRQRSRFLHAVSMFNDTEQPERERWYSSAPPWNSILWYYNYFVMSSLLGNANINQGGIGVIKSIQHKTISIGAGTSEGSVAIDEIDSSKAVVMLQGSSLSVDDEEGVYFTAVVYPYISALSDTEVKAKWSIAKPYVTNTKSATVSVIVIEYI